MSNGGAVSPTVTNCTFLGNVVMASVESGFASPQGGGMYTAGGVTTVTGCFFSSNSSSAVAGGLGGVAFPEGGGMFNESGPMLADSQFCGNTPDEVDEIEGTA